MTRRYPVYTNAQFHRALLARLERERAETEAKEGEQDETEGVARLGLRFAVAGGGADDVN